MTAPPVEANWLRPSFASSRAVGALMTTRDGGVSVAAWATMNVGDRVGDAPDAVAENRRRLAAACAATPVYLHQVHGARVERLGAGTSAAATARLKSTVPTTSATALPRSDAATPTGIAATASAAAAPRGAAATPTGIAVTLSAAVAPRGAAAMPPPPTADAAVTSAPGVACVVQVADCLPVLLATRAPARLAVGAAHAGWRGLAAGVLEASVEALCAEAGCGPEAVEAWLGPCIGAAAFEVGDDVRAAFDAASPGSAAGAAFRPLRAGKWLADLRRLARLRLSAAGVARVVASDACTVADASRFFSFRRDGVTGRMAAAVWIRGDA